MTYGPIDLLALEFNNNNLKGEILPELYKLVQNQIVRVVDLVMIQKHSDGKYEVAELQQLSPELISAFDPLKAEISGIIQVEDIEMIAKGMDNDTTAAVMLFENLWSIKFAEAVVRAKGRVLAHDRIPFEVVNETLEVFGKSESSPV
jgi:hypothetical protein